MLWSFAYFFCVLCSYYILRPLRDEMGVTVGPDGLQWLFVIVFSRHARGGAGVRLGRVALSPQPHRADDLWLFHPQPHRLLAALQAGRSIGRCMRRPSSSGSAYSTCIVVSLFWSVMSDAWAQRPGQAAVRVHRRGRQRRRHHRPAADAEPGAIAGPTQPSARLGLLLAVAIACAVMLRRRISSGDRPGRAAAESRRRLAGWLGARRTLQSPYLRKIALWVLLANLIGTFFYLEQARIIGETMATGRSACSCSPAWTSSSTR